MLHNFNINHYSNRNYNKNYMAGHSHASNVAARKNAQGLKKAKKNTMIARKLTVLASRNPDPATNLPLANEIKKARSMGFPKENMDKLLKSASGQKTLINIDRIVYDAFWNGIGLIIVVETDNNGRTAPQIKSIMNKNGGEVKTPNSVTHMFKEIGLLSINTKKLGISNETIESQAIECGCDDYVINEKDPEDDESNEAFNVHFDLKDFASSSKKLLENLENELKGKECSFVEDHEISWIPQEIKTLSKDKIEAFNKLLDLLEDNDDVINVYHNAEFEE